MYDWSTWISSVSFFYLNKNCLIFRNDSDEGHKPKTIGHPTELLFSTLSVAVVFTSSYSSFDPEDSATHDNIVVSVIQQLLVCKSYV